MIATSPRFLERDEAVGVDVGDLGVGRVVVADRGDVPRAAVRVADDHARLLGPGGGVQDPRARQDLEPDGRRGARVVLRPFLHPVAEVLVRLGVAEQPEAALVGDLAERLAEEDARLRRHDVDPSTGGFPGEDRVILVGQVAPQAEPEPTLAGGRPVAGPHVATGLAERRDHVVPEADRLDLVHPRDVHRRPDLDAPPPGHDRRLPVPLGDDLPLARDRRHARVEAGPVEGACQVADRAVRVGRRRDELPGASVADERRLARLDVDLRGRPDRVARRVGHRPGARPKAAERTSRVIRRGTRIGCSS